MVVESTIQTTWHYRETLPGCHPHPCPQETASVHCGLQTPSAIMPKGLRSFVAKVSFVRAERECAGWV